MKTITIAMKTNKGLENVNLWTWKRRAYERLTTARPITYSFFDLALRCFVLQYGRTMTILLLWERMNSCNVGTHIFYKKTNSFSNNGTMSWWRCHYSSPL